MNTRFRDSAAANGLSALAWAGLIFFMSSRPVTGEPLSWIPPHADKLAHFAVYSVLGFLFARSLFLAGLARPAAAVFALILASAYGITDEWHQSFVPGRDVEVLDWAADTFGAAAAVLIWNGKRDTTLDLDR